MRIASYTSESIVDGPGFRFTVFVQGCSHHCKGCHNPQTWDFEGGYEISVDELIAEAKKSPLNVGITISGGEPFQQELECWRLAFAAHEAGLDVWVYSGFTLKQILKGAVYDDVTALFLSEIDVLVDGPFIEELKSYECEFRGSTNQRIIDISGRGIDGRAEAPALPLRW